MTMLSIRNRRVVQAAIRLCAGALLVGLVANASSAQQERCDTPLTTAEIARRVTPTVVTIVTRTGNGSGVIVDPSGVVATNLHVIEGETDLELTLFNDDIYDDVSVVDFDERRDLVLLKIKAFNVTASALGDSDNIEVGEDVVLVGSPQGLESTVSEGVVSAVRDTGNGYRMLQTSAPASPGSSGGGMFNACGELIGIVTSQDRQGQNLNFAMPINYLRGLLLSSPTNGGEIDLDDFVSRPTSGNDSNVRSGPESSGGDGDVDPADSAKFSEIMEYLVADEDLKEIMELQEAGDGRWRATLQDDNNPIPVHIRLITDEFDDGMVWISGYPPDPDDSLTVAQLTELLQLNYNLNYAKVTLGEDGLLYTMLEAELRTLDAYGMILGVYGVHDATVRVRSLVDKWSGAVDQASTLTREPHADDVSVNLLGSHALIRFDSSEWREEPAGNDDVLVQYSHESDEVFVSVIAERSQIPMENIPDIALQNMQDEDPNAKITTRGYRTVNDAQVSYAEISASISGIPIAYLGHFYSDSSGTVQIIGATASNLFEEHKRTIERFVAGFEVSDP